VIRINKAGFLPAVGAALLLIVGAAEAADRPNIILVMSDDQGWGDTGYNGHEELKTPALDRMSKEGITFTRFYSASAVCSPTRGSIYTGRHPHRYGITYAMEGHLEPNERCLTTILKQAGYTTGHFGKWHLGTLSKTKGDQNRWGLFHKDPERWYCPPWERNVDVCFVTESKVPTWDPMIHPGKPKKGYDTPVRDPATARPFGNDYFTGPGEKAVENLRGDDSRIIMDRAIPFIRQAAKRRTPFLAIIWFHTPHSPIVGGGKYKAMYKHLSIEKQHYYGCITAMDDQVGRLRTELDNLKIAGNTMLWFCSDNGPARQGSPRHVGTAKHLKGYKTSLRDGGIRVPGLLVWPDRFPKPRTVNTPCVTTDYLPTLLAALGIPLPNDRPYDGINILPLIEDTGKKRPHGIGFVIGKQKAWIEHQYKLYSEKSGWWRLHDMLEDPGEETSLSKTLPEVKERLKRDFDAWYGAVRTDLKKTRPDYIPIWKRQPKNKKQRGAKHTP
jgi:arylsulfatase A-like enzyme